MEVRLKPLKDLMLLFKGHLIEFREDWVWYLTFMSFSSVMFLVFLWLSVGRANPASALYIITGSLTQTLTSSGMLALGQQIGFMKNTSIFDHFAALPISKAAFIAAMVSKSLLFSLPSLVFSLAFASLILKIKICLSASLLLATILGGYSLVGIGAVVGFYSRTERAAILATQYLSPVITFLAPVFMPKEALPRFLQFTSAILPTTYVASAFRGALSGQPIAAVFRELGVLALWIAGSMILVFPKLDWRGRKD